MARLSLRAVAVAIGERRLVEGLDLDIEPGERVAVQGPSGSGKTTLLRAVAGLVDLAAGAVRLDDELPAAVGWPLWRRRVTWVAQQPVLLDGTVHDNLARPFRYRHVGGTFSDERAQGWLEQLGMSAEHMEQRARTLSVGQQQRVALVRALAIEPEVLLLDEPTSALDAETAEAVESVLGRWCDERGGSMIAVTHDAAQAERLGDKRIDLRDHPPSSEESSHAG